VLPAGKLGVYNPRALNHAVNLQKKKERIMRTFIPIALATAFIAGVVSESAAGDCNISGTLYASSSGTPVRTSTNGTFNGQVCGFTVYGPNGNCFLKIDNSDTVSTGDCLTVGKGVTITTDGTATLGCTSTLCDDGIEASALGSGNASIDGLNFEGCWLHAIDTISTNDQMTNMTMDFGAYTANCATLTFGISGADLVDHVEITGANDSFGALGTLGVTSTEVRNSIFRNCRIGMTVSSSVSIDNVLFWENDIAMRNNGTAADLSGSHLVGNVCDCAQSNGTCTAISNCVDVLQTSFLEDQFLD
jgi:hypothetical protein